MVGPRFLKMEVEALGLVQPVNGALCFPPVHPPGWQWVREAVAG